MQTSKKILMVIAPVNFRDEELRIPKKIFEEKKHTVAIAASYTGVARGKLGAQVVADIALKEVSADDWDALVFVGGGGCRVYWDDKAVHELIKEAHKKGKVIAAICSAAVILANAGILTGKQATVFPEDKEKLINKDVLYSLENVVSDSKIVTANGPAAAIDFAHKILEELQ